MAAATVHPTAILQGDIRLGADVCVGPFCVLDAPPGTSITLGQGTRLIGNVYLTGPLTMGERNTVYPFASLGFPPQDLKWDPAVPGAGLRIGSGNVFREHVSIHRATSHEHPTVVGNNNYWMACSHAGHDAVIADNCIFANGVLLAGFVRIDDRAIIGGNTTSHQFCRVGRGTMLSGSAGLTLDLPPYFMLTALNVAGSINLVGLRRSGASSEQIDTVKWIYRMLCRQAITPKKALEIFRQRADQPLVAEYIQFIESSKRGICTARRKASRGAVELNVGE
jgi:UDP-N-acetylglucosamine acyltransferase